MSAKDIDTVTSFEPRNGAAARQYDSTRPKKEPFTFRVADSPEFVVEEPDGYTVMDIEEAKTSRSVLKLFLGDQYEDLEDYIGPLDPDVLVDIARDMSKHFGLFDADSAINRAERRSRDRRRGGRGRR
ncbi:hypothetical protein [Prescottella equi]|uniref:hypothetical protein n=1 Tax=Rhodococcus hoagii TaxID=43767 RepID=UPI000AFD50B9|nr:hypothetical protein [Prescottella equi]NKR42005.1 hypothetical protein [Prescottella equi]NKS17761.1 hypothetical protein [Prescottella equi]NKS97499.1 hypothetical protein [Prescottella equi]NKV95319.1 hypothetical protein [Prescottella equi]NKW08022.1 hypothetical protein [Prescottella equi]